MVNRRIFTIIVAAGSGSRFGSDVPKQFLPLAGRPVVMHSIDTFRRAFAGGTVLLVLSPDAIEYWQGLCAAEHFESPAVVPGGDSRSASVRSALRHIKATGCSGDDVVMIHDGARPLITEELAGRVLDGLDTYRCDGVVPGYAPSDSLMRVGGRSCYHLDREGYRLVQTPQAFRAEVILRAYETIGERIMSDDASVVAAAGGRIKVVEGDRTNIKITHLGDIEIAGLYLGRRKR